MDHPCLSAMLLLVVMAIHGSECASIDAASLALAEAASKMKSCSDTSRAVFKDCVKLLATNDKEIKTCATEFTNSFPACFDISHTSPESPDGCSKRCWKSYGSCTGYSIKAAEHFICWNRKAKCQSACSSSSDTITKLYTRAFSKRTVASCLSTCEGFGDACRGQVNSYDDYVVCIMAKEECRQDCNVRR